MTMENQRGLLIFRTYFVLLICWILFFTTFAYGTTGFNYDYSSSCARPYRSGKSHNPVAVPCDLNKQTYCNLPGASYPWHAVRRFVHENQGLMRRMYGDQRHISVLKTEIENNYLDDDFHPGNRDDTYGRSAKDDDLHNTKNMYSKKPTGRSSDSHSVPHFRPVQTTPTSHKQKIVKEKDPNRKNENQTAKEQSGTTKQNNGPIKQEKDNVKIMSYKTSFLEDETLMNDQPSNNLEMNKIEPELISLEVAIKQSIETNSIYPNYGSNLKNASNETTQKPTSTSTINEQKTTVADTTTSEYITSHETTTTAEIVAETTTEEENGGWKPVSPDKLSTLPPSMLFSESVKNEKHTSNDRIDQNTVETVKVVEQSKPASTTASSTNNNNQNNMEGMLFQDVVQEEVKPVMKLRGVNACPVKEEVVAPFWANNTRGEILALLNLYPFEQYVHWEKCVHEHKQMFCRDGCRCEQQYRLHRLLAYDPNNECRGIFSDWFRFPSCCVCKCYDMPLEFRVTSRSPRSIEPEIDEAVKQEMYHQAASDWYTINLEG